MDLFHGERLVFADRRQAGLLLAKRLKEKHGQELAGNPMALIVAIPRGGVITGDAVAEFLGIGMDVVVSRKVGAPDNPELAIGAVTPDGSFFANSDIIAMLGVDENYINEQVAVQRKEIERRLSRFRGKTSYQLDGKTIILVDDGIATGATVFAAINWLQKQSLRKLIVAVPVCSREATHRLRQLAESVVVLHSPLLFGAVGEFYQDFTQVEDEEVVAIMQKYR